ncbi:MAG: peptide chain release factor N(5)-glutamine methyltransferase [Planctomycetaceae bacterium]
MSSTTPAANADWTVRRILDWTINHLRDKGSDSPRLDAEVLLAHAWNCPRIQLYTRYDIVVPDDVRARMRDLVKRRAAAEPVAYLVGRREFFSLDFEVRPGVFIPRPTTEMLVIEAIAFLKDRPAPRVLDLCTGSGCIAISIARHTPAATVFAIDRNPLAVEVATANAARHGVGDRVTVLEGDLFDPIADFAACDVIVTNPPYVRTDELPTLAADIRDHEPHLALDAGADGLDTFRRIIPELPARIVPGGLFLAEMDPQQVTAVTDMLNQTGAFGPVTPIADTDRQHRGLRAIRESNG